MFLAASEEYFEEWRPLIAEIAHQLDQRIRLHSISGLHRDLEQFSDVMSLLRLLYLDNKRMCKHFGSSVIRRVFIRLMEVLFLLRNYGYSVDIHGPFSRHMVSKYGLPPSNQYYIIARICARHDPDHLKFLIGDVAEDDEERTNALVLSDCLDAMIKWNHQLNTSDKEKLFGEIAYQLDSRILKLVTDRVLTKYTASVQDFLDILLQNCNYLIENNTSKSIMSRQQVLRILRRFLRVFLYLHKHGYIFEEHATFSKNIIQRFGRKGDSNYCSMLNWCTEEDSTIIRSLLFDLAENENEARNINVLFDCLKSLAEVYDCLVFSYG
ncbi:Hypothetical predicted protein [Octopus vulgaris]|uniref:Uncharacterized protein n=2 Tax=Octopus TaxID=6643 RepID=A0AA36F6I2_OCTVU|nr:uncharacterized protein LOC118765177 [Octopus sinensis]XP_036362731.1 uncharacterized protein LOC118765177 [Octopus sinensis]CAI9727596.1 Hypothetical predicted protein [Octopus vulgaris]